MTIWKLAEKRPSNQFIITCIVTSKTRGKIYEQYFSVLLHVRLRLKIGPISSVYLKILLFKLISQ